MILKFRFYNVLVVLVSIGILTSFSTNSIVNSDAALTITPTVSPVFDGTSIPQEQKRLFISDVLQDIGENCHLPCFLAFQPSETTFNSVIAYLKETGFSSSWESSPERKYYPTLEDYLRDSGTFIFRFLGKDEKATGYLAVSFVMKNGLINKIDIESADLDWLKGIRWIDLPTIISETPYTPEIYIAPLSRVTDYTVLLVYQEINTLIVYNFDFLGNADPNTPGLPFCFDIDHTRDIHISINDLDEEMLSSDPVSLKKAGYKTFKESYGINTETLIQFFADHPDTCLDPSQYKNT
jgi:hypothetical protein